MISWSIGKIARFNDLPPGACFAFSGAQIGIKATTANKIETRGIELSKLPAGIQASKLNGSILYLENALILPDFSPLKLRPGAEFDYEPGALLMHKTSNYISYLHADNTVWLANLNDGVVQEATDNDQFVWTTQWKVVVKVADDNECIFASDAA